MNKLNKLILLGSLFFIFPFSTKNVEASELAVSK